jgi:hypothetical protein
MSGPVGAKSAQDKSSSGAAKRSAVPPRSKNGGGPAEVLALQRAVGNQAVEKIMEFGVQKEPPGENSSAPLNLPITSLGAGQPLNKSIRGNLERFGLSLDDVRLHTDETAVKLSQGLQAEAFTFGKHIFLGNQSLDPEAAGLGPTLLHELVHTHQANHAGSLGSGPVKVTQPNDRYEHEANGAVDNLLTGKPLTSSSLSIASQPVAMRETKEEALKKKFGPSPAHPVAGGGPPPVPEVGKTPFHFISEGPALPNWKKSVTEVLEREFDKKFSSFEEAHAYFKQYLQKLSSTEDREDFADRMRDRVRKNFYRQEGRSPSFKYAEDEKLRLKGGGAPRETLQLEHLSEVKTDVPKKITGHPELALDPSNVWFTEGGVGGTAPKGTPHAEKANKILRSTKGEKDVEKAINEKPPSPAGIEVEGETEQIGKKGVNLSSTAAREEVAATKGLSSADKAAAKGLQKEEAVIAKVGEQNEAILSKRIPSKEFETQGEHLEGMGLRSGPSAIKGALFNIGVGIAGSLLTSWLHDKIKESVENMPPIELKAVRLWQKEGVRGHSSLDLLASNLPEAVDQLYTARGRAFFELGAFWNDLDKSPESERGQSLADLEDSVWSDQSRMVQALDNVRGALQFEGQIKERVEAAADLQRWIENPNVYYYLVIDIGFQIEEVEQIKDNLAWFQASFLRSVLEPLHKLQTKLEQSIEGNDALLAQIKRTPGYQSRLQRFLSGLRDLRAANKPQAQP